MISKINPTLHHWAMGFFLLQMVLGNTHPCIIYNPELSSKDPSIYICNWCV